MIQGLGTDSRGWALQRLAFGRQFRCITIDNRGVGRTDRPPGAVLARADGPRRDRGARPGARRAGPRRWARRWAASSPRSSGCCTRERTRSLVLACTACRHHEWRRELLAGVGRRGRRGWHGRARRRGACSGWSGRGCAGASASGSTSSPASCCSSRRAVHRAGRARSSTRPTSCRYELVNDPRADARHHRLAGRAHAGRRRRGARRAHPARAARGDLGGAAHGLMAEAPTASTKRCCGSSPTSTRPTTRSTSRPSPPDPCPLGPAAPSPRLPP